MKKQSTSRRNFVQQAAAGAVGATLLSSSQLSASAAENPMPESSQLKQLVKCLGGPWPATGDLRPKVTATSQKKGYRIETVTYEVEPDDHVSAHLLVPDGIDAIHSAPAIAVWHQHNGQYHLGKSEPAGLDGNPMHHTGVALAKEGYVVLCPDALCFEERQDPTKRLAGMQFERFEFLRYVVAGKCMAWKNILDMRRAVDYLCSRPEVNSDRLGCYGHSMGSTHTWLVGPHEPRLRAFAGNCCLPTYNAIEDHHLLHCFPNFVPGWSQFGDTPDIAGLIAPRALHLNLGENDGGSPIEHAKIGIQRIEELYKAANAQENFTAFIETGVGHVLSERMWAQTKTFFDRHLRS